MIHTLQPSLWPRTQGQTLLRGFQPLQHRVLANLSHLISKPTTLAPFSFPPPPLFPSTGRPSLKHALPQRPTFKSHFPQLTFFPDSRAPLLFFLSKPCFSQGDEDPPDVPGLQLSCKLCKVLDCVCFILDPGPRRMGFVEVQ